MHKVSFSVGLCRCSDRSQPDFFRVQVVDEGSRHHVVDVRIEPGAFARALAGEYLTGVLAEYGRLDVVGMAEEYKHVRIDIARGHGDNYRMAVRVLASAHEVDGWEFHGISTINPDHAIVRMVKYVKKEEKA